MPVQFGGLASGLDTSSMITQLVALERIPINNMTSKKNALTGDITRIGAISNNLSNLEDALEGLTDSNGFSAFSASSSNEDAFTVSTSAGAAAGNFDIEINALAERAKFRSDGYDPGHTFTEGALDLTVWGEDAVSVDIPEGATIQEVRDLINDSDADVSAVVLNDGTQDYLSISANKTGYPLDGVPGDALQIGSGTTGLVTNQTQAATNAEVVIDGLTVTSASNSVSGAVEGVTFELIGTTSTTERVNVTPDNEKILEQASAFVDAYNAAVDAIKAQSDEGAERRALNDFGRAVSQASSDGVFPNLASIGISTTATGRLELDSDAFEEAINTDGPAAAKVFSGATGVAASLTAEIERYTKSDGVLDAMEDAAQAGIERLETSIERKELSLDRFESRLTRQFSVMEQLIAQMNDQSNQFASMLVLTPNTSNG